MKSSDEIMESFDKSKDEIENKIAVHFLKSTVNRLVKESKWLTSVGLALLGFYSALLVQLKLSGIEPINITSLMGLTSLAVSLVTGFWIKLCLLKDNIVDNLFPDIKEILERKLEVELDEEPSRKTPDEVVESISKSLPPFLVIVQAATLFVAIVIVCIYLLIFLN